jgi:hypothetical protein
MLLLNLGIGFCHECLGFVTFSLFFDVCSRVASLCFFLRSLCYSLSFYCMMINGVHVLLLRLTGMRGLVSFAWALMTGLAFFCSPFFWRASMGFSCLRGEDKYYIFSCLMLFFLPLSWSCDDLPPAADRRKRSINGLIESIKNVP